MTGFTLITASKIQDSSGHLLANGKAVFSPVDNKGRPVSFMAGGANGMVVASDVVFLIVAGALTFDLFGNAPQLADTTMTTPLNVGYRLAILDTTGNEIQGPGYSCLQPSGTTWNLDTYVPNLATQSLIQAGPPGPAGPATTIAIGTVTALPSTSTPTVANVGTSTALILNFGIPAPTPTPLSEVPSGVINGSNTSFSISHACSPLFLYLNGQFQVPGVDYTISGTTITFAVAPTSGDSLYAQGTY